MTKKAEHGRTVINSEQAADLLNLVHHLCAEIKKRDEENYRLRLAIALLTNKRGRGRPKENKSDESNTRRGRGRPTTVNKNEMVQRLEAMEVEKKAYLSLQKKDFISDKDFASRLLDEIIKLEGKPLRDDKKKKIIKKVTEKYRNFRDKTGIRQKR